jgi:hypothetical protein
MKKLQTSLAVLTLCTATVLAGGLLAQKPAPTSSTATQTANETEIGGAPVVTLKRPASSDRSKPHLLEATILPGRGMNLLQIKAYLLEKGR